MSQAISLSIIAPEEPCEFFELMWEGVRSAISELSHLGAIVHCMPTRHHDPEAEQRILTELLDQEINAIAVVPAHTSALNALIDQHVAQGTPVVTFNSDAPQSRRSLFVGPDPVHAGKLAGELLAKFMGGRGRVVSFPGSLENDHIAKRYQAFRLQLATQAKEIQEIDCRPGMTDLERIATEALSELEGVEGIYVGCAGVFHVARALEQLGLRVPCVGFDNTLPVQRFLLEGTVSAVVDQSRYQQGYFAVQKAFKFAQKREASELLSIHIPSTVVLGCHVTEYPGSRCLSDAFEQLVQQRTAELEACRAKLETANSELLRRVETDPLTGLLNHGKFQELLQTEVARAMRGGVVSLLMLDLDSLKLVNDSYGHPVGDESLKAVAEVLRTCCRSTDYCARYGGDEFSVILPATGRAESLRLVDRILDQMAQSTILAGDRKLPLRVSIGIASFPQEAGSAGELVIAADRAMYRSKRDVTALPQAIFVDQRRLRETLS